MTQFHFRFRRIEEVIAGTADPTFSGDEVEYAAFDGRLRYERLALVDPLDPECPELLPVDNFSERLRVHYGNVMRTPGYIASGLFTFSDFCFFGPCALPLDIPTSTCLIGSAFNYEPDFTLWYLPESARNGHCRALAIAPDQQSFSVDFADDQLHRIDRPSILLSDSGYGIYGHWILDFVPRLHLLSRTRLPEEPEVYLGHLPPWAHGFLEAFGIDPNRVRPLPRGLTQFRRAIAPSALKSGERLAQPIMRDAWRRLKHYAETVHGQPGGRPLPRPRKIFISRERWAVNQRPIANLAQLKRSAAEHGYYILRPEEYSVFEQAAIFRTATAIVGEDGSGLHNVIFSEPGCTLGVIGVPDRVNLWHLGICKALGHRAAYIQAEANDAGERVVNPAAFERMLSVIDSH